MSNRTEAIDQAVLNSLSAESAVSITDLQRRGFRLGTSRNSLKRLLTQGQVCRRWDGNPRYGRFLYRLACDNGKVETFPNCLGVCTVCRGERAPMDVAAQ
jgi:hypothetical protein